MKASKSAISEDRKKQLAIGGFALVALIYLYFQFRDPAPDAAPPASPVVVSAPATPVARVAASAASAPAANVPGPAAKNVGTTSAALDPTLHMQAMLVTESVPYEGTGRNIFSAISAPAPVVIQKPVAAARPNPVAVAPVYQPPAGPPPPPPIDLKFCGFFESPSTGEKQAILTHGDDTFVARNGEIVQRRYRIVSIASKSIVIEDIPNNNKQTLPLLAN